MRRIATTLWTLLALAAIIGLIGGCTVVKIDEADSAGSDDQYSTWTKTGTGFQATEYVESIWDDRMIPTFEAEAVGYVDLMAALAADREANAERYGLLRQTGEPFHVFKVRGTAQVMEFDDSSRNGVIRVDHEPFNGEIDAVLQVGPVLRGTVLRDSVEFIRFTDVGNQLQFADLAKELNSRMRVDSVDPLDLANLPGQTIEYLGAFRLEAEEPLDEVVVTPLRLNVVASGE